MIYKTKAGDTLDQICFEYYGASIGYVEKVLDANRNLAKEGETYKANVKIYLPEIKIEQKPEDQTLSLWD